MRALWIILTLALLPSLARAEGQPSEICDPTAEVPAALCEDMRVFREVDVDLNGDGQLDQVLAVRKTTPGSISETTEVIVALRAGAGWRYVRLGFGHEYSRDLVGVVHTRAGTRIVLHQQSTVGPPEDCDAVVQVIAFDAEGRQTQSAAGRRTSYSRAMERTSEVRGTVVTVRDRAGHAVTMRVR